MNTANVRRLFVSEKKGSSSRGDIRLNPGEGTSFRFDADGASDLRLLVKGESDQHYFWKSEAQCFSQYVGIGDALDREHASVRPYCVDLSNLRGENYPKALYKKLIWPPRLSYLALYGYTDDWSAGLRVHADSLEIPKGAYLRVCFEIYESRPGVSPYDLTAGPDRVVTLDIPSGSYRDNIVCADLKLHYERDPDDTGAPIFGSDPGEEIAAKALSASGGERQTAAICFYVEGQGYRGGVWVEEPFITSSNGYNIMYDFAPPASAHGEMDWIGQNLSRAEWPEFALSLNGKEFFRGERFERCQRYSEWEIDLPRGLIHNNEENVLTVTLVSSYREALPYRIGEVALIESPHGEIVIDAVPDVMTVGRRAGILLTTARPGTEVTFSCGGVISAQEKTVFAEAGLNVLPIVADGVGADVEFTLRAVTPDGAREVISGTVRRIVEKNSPDVPTGSGDMIYINTESREDIDCFLRWYFANRCGDLVTVRPVYRWTGCRVINEENYRHTVSILEGLGVKWAHMLDGREVNGIRCNPPMEMLRGEGFVGRQTHEYDGAFIYWAKYLYRGNDISELTADFTMREIAAAPDVTEPKKGADLVFVHGDRHYLYRDYENMPTDMQRGEELVVERLRQSRHGATRHTGPSTAFRCFAKAGYTSVGAELMYGPTELISSFLRGVRDCYGLENTMSHLAVQWSTSPHDVEERYRRFRLALYVCYMQDSGEINTEEGFWHLEEYYSSHSRYDDACINHRKQQSDFLRYTSTHDRSGVFETPFAFVSGRCDGWRSFGADGIWGNPDLPHCEAEDSWDLLKIFYPLSKPTGDIYLHPCPTDHPVGFYSGTPRGCVDAVPAESPSELLAGYRCLFFAGYNKADAGDLARLADYVRAGGQLLLGLPHLSVTSERADVVALRHEYLDCELASVIGGGDFADDTAGGLPVRVRRGINHGEVLSRTDSGEALAVRYALGKGSVTFVNAAAYPADAALMPVYSRLIEEMTQRELDARPFGIECGDDVQYAVRKQDDGSRHIYLLAVDWYRDPAPMRHAVLRLGSEKYDIEIPFGTMYKIVLSRDCAAAAWSLDEEGEVGSVGEGGFVCRGFGKGVFGAAKDGKIDCYNVIFQSGEWKTVEF